MNPGFMVLIIFYIIYIFLACSFPLKYLDNLKYSKKIFATLFFLPELFVNILNKETGISYISAAALYHILTAILIFTAFGGCLFKKLFVVVILTITKTLAFNFGCSFFSLPVLLAGMFINGQADIITGLEDIITAASYGLVALVLIILYKKSGTIFSGKIKDWYFTMSVPLIFIILIIDIVNWAASNGIMVMVVSDASGTRYWDIYYNQIYAQVSVCILTALSACIAAGFVYGMNKIYTEQKQKEWYYEQKEFYRMLNAQNLKMERLRHDMKNHVLALYGLWENKEFNKIGSYLNKMLEAGNICSGEEATGNKVIDILLYNKKKQAEQNKICIKPDINIPGNCVIDEFDLCVLFGNILDNSINSCIKIQDKQYKFIHIKSYKVKKFFLLTVKNGTAIKDIKEIKQGTGLQNIKWITGKYNGVINMEVLNNVFKISILLPVYTRTDNIK